MKTVARLTLLFLLISAACAPAIAQFAQRGTLNGVVTDSSGGVVPNATVTVTDTARNQTTTQQTNDSGRYEFTQLVPGSYTIAVEAQGFKKTISDSLRVTTQGVTRYDAKLLAGAVTEQVEVSAATPLIQSENVNVDLNIPEQQVETLPINGRNWTSLTELTPGVSTSPRNNINLGGTFEVGASYTSGGADYTAGGNAEGSRDNGYYINGVNANENYESGSSFQPSAEAIGEVKIGVVDFSAQYGRDFTNVNVSTKAGTDSFHGEAYEYFENDALNALVPYVKATTPIDQLTKAAYRFNQFGGNFGGPVRIPHLVNLKDRAFFFVNYEQNPKSLDNGTNQAIVPSTAERAGNFAEDCTGPVNNGTFNGAGICSTPQGQIYNPYTGAPVAYNDLVAAGLYNPATAPPQVSGIANLLPTPNLPTQSTGANYQYTSRQAVNPYHLDTRFDYRISSKDSVFVAWSKYGAVPNNSGGLVPNLSPGSADVADSSYVVSADEAHVFSPRLTNEFIFAIGSGKLSTLSPAEVAYANSSANPFNQIFSNTGTAAGGNTGILGLNIYNYGPLYSNNPAGFNQYFADVNTSLQFNNNMNWIRGDHNFSFGFNYLRKSEKDFDSVRYVSFGCAPSAGADCVSKQVFTSNAGTGGDAFADVLLGVPTVIHQRFGYSSGGPFAPEPNLIIPYYGAYFSDQWKATDRLTLTYGLRYDLPIPPYATNDVCCAVYQAAQNQLAIPGIAPGLPQHYAPAPKTDFAPRFSFAWQQARTRVIRAGYGLYWNSGASQISNLLTGAFYGGTPGGFYGQETDFPHPVPNSITQVFGASPIISPGTFPNSTGPGQGNYGPDQFFVPTFYADKQSFRTPYIHRYMLDIQQQINPDTAVTLSYLGAEGRNGWYYADVNVPAYRTGWPSVDAFNAARPNNSSYFGDVYVQRAGLNSNYNAAIIKLDHRMAHGVQILSHYTWAKTLGQRGANGQYTNDVGWNYPQNIIRSYGETTNSHRHRFLFETLWQPQYEHILPGYLRPALGGWHLSAIATLESGNALTAVNGAENQANDYAAFDFGPGNLNVVRNPNLPHNDRTYSHYFDTSAFVVPPAGVQGTADPGTIRGPGQNNWDVSVGKIFPIYESLHAEFRADAFNAFNHTQWNSVSTQYQGYTGPFGQVNGSREGRIVQLAGKIVF